MKKVKTFINEHWRKIGSNLVSLVIAVILVGAVFGPKFINETFASIGNTATIVSEKAVRTIREKAQDNTRERYRTKFNEPKTFAIANRDIKEVDYFGIKKKLYLIEIIDPDTRKVRALVLPQDLYEKYKHRDSIKLYDDEKVLYDQDGDFRLLKVLEPVKESVRD